MADPPPDADSGGGTPRWVKVFGAVAIVVVLLVVALMLIGGGPGGHGPGRHLGGDGRDRRTPPAGIPEQSGDHTGPPPGVDHGPRRP